MGLEELLEPFAGQTDTQLEVYSEQFSGSQAVLELFKRLKEKLIDEATSEEEKNQIEESSKDVCGFFAGKEDELAELLEEDFKEKKGLPVSPPILRKAECGCDGHYYADFCFHRMHHSENGFVIQYDSKEKVTGPISQTEYVENYNENEYGFVPCGHTWEDIEGFISGQEKELARDLAHGHSDWCGMAMSGRRHSGAREGNGQGAINQIPGFPGQCQQELRVIIPLKAVTTWTRLVATAELLNRCPNIQTAGFVIGDERNGSGEQFKRVWKMFYDDGNMPTLPLDVGLIVANGDSSERIQRWDGSTWS